MLTLQKNKTEKQRINHKSSNLVLASVLHNFLIDNLVHNLKPLDGFLFRDADILLLQWNRTEGVVEEEQSTVEVDAEKSGNVTVVGKSCRQCHQPHVFLGGFNVTNCPRNNIQTKDICANWTLKISHIVR